MFAFNEEQELKDVLVELIKTQYKFQEKSDINIVRRQAVVHKTTHAKLGINRQNNTEKINVVAKNPFNFGSGEELSFSNFTFTITHNQAVVRFALNHQMKSAFLEKNGDEWKLVVIADLPEMFF